MKYRHKQYKLWRRRLKKHSRLLGVSLLAIVGIGVLIVGEAQDGKNVHTAELLDTIAKVESRGNYNAHYGAAGNTAVQFTSMSVGEVLAWQKQFVEQGNPSSAVGRYQFIDSTLRGLVRELQISHDEIFSPALQDRLAIALLERRGVYDYVDNKISREQFAHNLSKEWAALPRAIGDNPETSYYAGDGLNKAQLSIGEIYASIATVRKL